jgi:hypothetical protein
VALDVLEALAVRPAAEAFWRVALEELYEKRVSKMNYQQ